MTWSRFSVLTKTSFQLITLGVPKIKTVATGPTLAPQEPSASRPPFPFGHWAIHLSHLQRRSVVHTANTQVSFVLLELAGSGGGMGQCQSRWLVCQKARQADDTLGIQTCSQCLCFTYNWVSLREISAA